MPSGWTPLELVQHLAFMERRSFVWGFIGEQVDDPWGDSQGARDAAWLVPSTVSLDDVLALLTEQAARTDALLESTPLEQLAATTGRFRTDPPDLRYVCFHVLQEYARHAGHLDVAVELAGGPLASSRNAKGPARRIPTSTWAGTLCEGPGWPVPRRAPLGGVPRHRLVEVLSS